MKNLFFIIGLTTIFCSSCNFNNRSKNKEKKSINNHSSKTENNNLAEENKAISPIKSQFFKVNNYSFEMIFVEGGEFEMGCINSIKTDCYSDEFPIHKVKLKSYYIGKYEVTQGLWLAVMGNNKSKFTNCGPECPAENISWDEAKNFINHLNKILNKNFMLPTEAEWEYAARGGKNWEKTKILNFICGENLDDEAWTIFNSGHLTHKVGLKKPNILNLYDLNGNVWEWCEDWYGSYSNHSVESPVQTRPSSHHVFRGGSYNSSGFSYKVSDRSTYPPIEGLENHGIRLVLKE